jgi:hypothetical protein
MARKQRSTRRKSARNTYKRGGGWSLDPSKMVSVGNLENMAYSGAGKDCVSGSFVRPGFISGGRRSTKRTKGGRYETNPGALISGSDIGMSSYSGVNSIACERGTVNSLNMRGGADVTVGAADSMRLYAPTAGYGHQFETMKAPSAVGGLMLNTPYDARAFNPACTKTGGGSAAVNGAPYSSLEMSQITGRGGFDGSSRLLPMKFGGKRRNKRSTKKRSTKKRSTKKH